MEQFAYSFAITMMHSIWQMALLMLFYYASIFLFPKWPALAKRNLLLFIIVAQLISSATSFYFIYNKPFLDYREDIQAFLQSLQSSQSWLQQYAPALFALYALGLLYKAGHAWFSWKKFNRFYKGSYLKAAVDIRLFTEAKALHFGIRRKVQVWCSEHIHSPVTFGFLRPVILLPVALVNQLNLQQTESLIVHELTHIKNNDYVYNWLLLAADALFFFNPFMKMAVEKVKLEREKSCDVQVLQFNYPAISYAEALLQVARRQASSASLVLPAVSNKTALLDRIRYFSDEKNTSGQHSRHFSLAALLTWSFIVLNIFFAGVFVTVSKPQVADNKLTTFFSAAPINEWNRSFATERVQPAATGIDSDRTTETINDFSIAKQDADPPVVMNELKISTPEKLTLSTPVTTQGDGTILLTPVSYTEPKTLSVTVKDVIIDEEISGGKITQAYRVTTSATGEIKMEPLWMISEIKPSDSLKRAIDKDSSIIKLVPVDQ